jgi:hypothetical protein
VGGRPPRRRRERGVTADGLVNPDFEDVELAVVIDTSQAHWQELRLRRSLRGA